MYYEQKYKDVLEKLRDFYRDYDTVSHLIDVKEELANLFPELKESEDERMIKFIKQQLFNIKTTITDNYKLDTELTKAIDWLEKQGEQKEYTFKSLPRLLDMIEPTSKAKAYCQKLIDTLVKEGYATDAKIVGERLKIMNGEDVPMAIMDEKQGKETTWKPSKEEMDYCFTKMMNGEKVSSAWSEEDEKFFKTALWHISYSISNGESTDIHCDTTEWLKSLKDRVQPQPKYEWSEKDEHKIKDIIYFLDTAKKHYASTVELDACIDWLKSLKERYTWRPSDKQMAALHDLNLTGNISYAGQGQTLIELYNDLKKLKGE